MIKLCYVFLTLQFRSVRKQQIELNRDSNAFPHSEKARGDSGEEQLERSPPTAPDQQRPPAEGKKEPGVLSIEEQQRIKLEAEITANNAERRVAGERSRVGSPHSYRDSSGVSGKVLGPALWYSNVCKEKLLIAHRSGVCSFLVIMVFLFQTYRAAFQTRRLPSKQPNTQTSPER